MAQRKSNAKRFQNAVHVAGDMAIQDEAVGVQAELKRQERTTIVLDRIQERKADTREVNPDHVAALTESISVLGLLEPLVVDVRARLIAGNHRLIALRHLREEDKDTFLEHFPGEEIPVRMMQFDAAEESDRALQCEVAENEQRRDYTPTEVKALAERLKSAGYSYGKGRPSQGSKPILPALETIVGKSARTIQRYMKDELEENTTNVAFFPEIRKLELIGRHLKAWDALCADSEPNSKRAALKKKTPGLLRLIEQAIKETVADKE